MANNRSAPKQYGEVKKPWQILLAPAASLMLDALAAECAASRSDFVERVIRGLNAHDKETRDRLMVELGIVQGELDCYE